MILFLSLEASEAITCPQAFHDHYGLVKIPGTDETEAVLYTEADGLNIRQAMEEYGKLLNYWNYDGTTATQDDDTPTHLSFTLVNPTGTLLMTFAGVFQSYAQATQQVLDPDLAIQSRDNWKSFVAKA